ncbi:MAG: OmpA/MotB family protein [Pseudomonadota bacterium]
MIDEYRGRGRHDNLMRALPPDEDAGGWMVSYIDVMTLLVALLVLIITLGELGTGGEPEPDAESRTDTSPRVTLGVPLPEPLQRGVASREALPLGRDTLSQRAISAALGVAGLPATRPVAPPALLARRDAAAVPDDASRDWPRLVMSAAADPEQPLADYLLVLTDRPPADVAEVDADAIAGARAVVESLQDAPYLADLEGMEVSRIPEGVRLRVEDRLLFPTAEAELTEEGRTLVVERLREMVERHAGEVAVEGHSDSRAINTERFPSNWALSSARAIAIVEALVEAGIDASRLRAVGLADTRPLASNDSAAGRARNRRVEVVIQAR